MRLAAVLDPTSTSAVLCTSALWAETVVVCLPSPGLMPLSETLPRGGPPRPARWGVTMEIQHGHSLVPLDWLPAMGQGYLGKWESRLPAACCEFIIIHARCMTSAATERGPLHNEANTKALLHITGEIISNIPSLIARKSAVKVAPFVF